MPDVRELPYPPIWINAYIVDHLKQYDFNVLVVPSNP